ncbi:Tetratricopeptide repeat protein 25 [Fasciolopsis buskii]|uniref:Outer dynein arm-docking complex subunit 4 n=1 Tax=Fasciolopsis buskii TaxID=27845 RepID=A0A8E0VGW7_9TREM|nr:Tetratricopeptide repeat protein 25 [Fasciolopsis buski]
MKKNQHYSFIQRSGVVMRLMNAIKQWKTLHSVTGPMQKVGQSRLQLSFKLPPEALTIVLNEIIQVGQNLPTKTQNETANVHMVACKKHLLKTFDDKLYLQTFSDTESLRMKFLTAGTRRLVRKQPLHRIWLEMVLGVYIKTSEELRALSAEEVNHIKKQYLTNVRMDQWHRLQTITSHELSCRQNVRQMLLRERFWTTSRTIGEIWQMYTRSQFREAAHEAVVTLFVTEKWPGSGRNAFKWRFQSDLCHLIGMSLDGMKHYRAALAFFQMDARLAEYADIMVAKKRALDNIGRMYAVLGKYKEALACWTQRLKTEMSAEELAWLAYQIALCYTMLDDYKEAIRYCRICVKAAESENISCWAVSGYLLQATVAALLACHAVDDTRNLHNSLMCMEDAYNHAIRINQGAVINAVLEIIRKVYQMLFDEERDDSILNKCWSSSLLDMLRQENSNRSQFNMKIFRELLLQSSNPQNFI